MKEEAVKRVKIQEIVDTNRMINSCRKVALCYARNVIRINADDEEARKASMQKLEEVVKKFVNEVSKISFAFDIADKVSMMTKEEKEALKNLLK